jgi:ubiquitin carboxyl-terminal hydrolase L5
LQLSSIKQFVFVSQGKEGKRTPAIHFLSIKEQRMSWCTIESDPGVFSELISTLGVKDVAVEEIYSLEQEEQQRELSYGLVFLFKWREEIDIRQQIDPMDISDLFFAKQVVQNACATQAILSVLLNAEGVELGSELNEMKSFGAMLDAETRGMVIGQSDVIRVTHNSFARPEPFVSEETKALNAEKEDAYHFIAYVPFRGSVYE